LWGAGIRLQDPIPEAAVARDSWQESLHPTLLVSDPHRFCTKIATEKSSFTRAIHPPKR